MLRADLGRFQRGDDKAEIGLAAGDLRLADDAAIAAPGVQRRPQEVLEPSCRPSGPQAVQAGLHQFGTDRLLQSLVARQTEQKVHKVRLAPSDQRLAGEAGITTQQDAGLRPAQADPRHDPRDLLHRPGRAVDVGPPQPGRQQMTTAEDVERQVQ